MDINLAWLAGIIEGEGSFGKTTVPNQTKKFRIRVRMTDEDIICRVSKLFQVGYYKVNKKDSKHKDLFETTVSGKRAIDIYMRIEPLLGQRRKTRAREILSEITKNA